MESARRKLSINVRLWEENGLRLFGTRDRERWEFICPGCGVIASVRGFAKFGAPPHGIAKSCIGVFLGNIFTDDDTPVWGNGPCNFIGTADTLPVEVEFSMHKSLFCFHFADPIIYQKVDGPFDHSYYKHYEGVLVS